MIRIVLVGLTPADWKPFRQPQWMAEVRRDPRSSMLPKRHFDIDEAEYRRALDAWDESGAGADIEAAVALLARFGANEVVRP